MPGLKFTLGTLVCTDSIEKAMENPKFSAFTEASFRRYMECDWGDTDPADIPQNDVAVARPKTQRILAVYNIPDELKHLAVGRHGEKNNTIWIITESDNSVTTVLLPSDY